MLKSSTKTQTGGIELRTYFKTNTLGRWGLSPYPWKFWKKNKSFFTLLNSVYNIVLHPLGNNKFKNQDPWKCNMPKNSTLTFEFSGQKKLYYWIFYKIMWHLLITPGICSYFLVLPLELQQDISSIPYKIICPQIHSPRCCLDFSLFFYIYIYIEREREC